MEFLIGGYLLIGVWRAMGHVLTDDPSEKPVWMLLDRNPLVWAFKLTVFVAFYMLFWPFRRRMQ